MSDLNQVQIIGRLGNDPEMRYTASGSAIANMSVATTEKWRDKQTGEQQERTEWHRVSFFGRIAEVCGEYLKKGSQVYISGKLQTRKWQDQDGNDRWTTEIVGRDMQMLGGQQQQQPQQGGFRDSPPPQEAPQGGDSNNDIPF